MYCMVNLYTFNINMSEHHNTYTQKGLMMSIIDTHTIGFFSAVNNINASLHKWYVNQKAKKLQQQTINELSTLSDKELKDIGISRGEIYSKSKDAADKYKINFWI